MILSAARYRKKMADFIDKAGWECSAAANMEWGDSR